MNVDLSELMRERSAAGEPTVREQRLAEVRRRIARVRRHRAIATAAAACAVVAAVVANASLLPGHQESAPWVADSPTRMIDGFPEYGLGARVVATGSASLPDADVSVTVTPRTLDIVLLGLCSSPLTTTLAANGRELPSFGYCGPNPYPGTPVPGLLADDLGYLLDAYGVSVGEPVTFTMTAVHERGVSGGDTPSDLPLPSVGTIALAVMERVPFGAYPLPRRPDELFPLRPLPGTQRPVLDLRSDPDDPLRPVSGSLEWIDQADLFVAMQTPGYLHISVNGIVAASVERWDYHGFWELPGMVDVGDPERLPLDFPEGTVVTITVVPEHVTGTWRVAVVPLSPVGG